MHLLCCDWLLSTRADLWERTKLNDHKVDRVEGFYKDLKSLQKIASYLPDVMNKVIGFFCCCNDSIKVKQCNSR